MTTYPGEERELVCMLLAHLSVNLACVAFFLSFSLPLGVGGRLWVVIVALLGHFIYLLDLSTANRCSY